MLAYRIPLVALAVALLITGVTFSVSLAIDEPLASFGKDADQVTLDMGDHPATYDSQGNPCPPDDLPCIPLPSPDVTSQPLVASATVNGVAIPLPKGALYTSVILEPGGGAVFYTLGESRIQFLGNGWLMENSVEESDAEAFAPALDALHEAAVPITIRDIEIPIPIGATIKPIIGQTSEGFLGPKDFAPNLLVISLRESYLSINIDGTVFADEVRPPEDDEFGPVKAALAEANAR